MQYKFCVLLHKKDKKRPKVGAIFGNANLVVNISGTEQDIDSQKTGLEITIFSYIYED